MDVTTSNAVSTVQSVSICLSQTWKLETCPKILTSWLIDKLPSSKNILDKNLIKVFILFVNKQKIQDTTALALSGTEKVWFYIFAWFST